MDTGTSDSKTTYRDSQMLQQPHQLFSGALESGRDVKLETFNDDSAIIYHDGDSKECVSHEIVARIKQEVDSEPSELICTIKTDQNDEDARETNQCSSPGCNLSEGMSGIENSAHDDEYDAKISITHEDLYIKRENPVLFTHSEGRTECDRNDEEECKTNIDIVKLRDCNLVLDNERSITPSEYKQELVKVEERHQNSSTHTRNSGGNIYKCTECEYVTRRRRDLSRHYTTRHDPDAPVYKCPMCEYTTKRQDDLSKHLRNNHEHEEDPEVYKCPQCEYVSKQKSKLALHVRIRHNIKNHIYVGEQKSQLASHVNVKLDEGTESGSEQLLTSWRSQGSFPGAPDPLRVKLEPPEGDGYGKTQELASDRVLARVREKVNTNQCSAGVKTEEDPSAAPDLSPESCWTTCDPLNCDVKIDVDEPQLLDAEFKGEGAPNEQQHCKTTRTEICELQKLPTLGNKPESAKKQEDAPPSALTGSNTAEVIFRCAQCDYVTRRKRELPKHFAIKHNPNANTYGCPQCAYTTKWAIALSSHVRVQHDIFAEVYKCAACDYTTKRKYDLPRHVRIRHDPDAVVYKCSQCQYVSKQKFKLAAHLRAEHDPHAEVYKCRECSYTTKRKHDLARHVRIKHDPDADVYKCRECSYTTKSKHDLSRHVRSKHNPDADVYKCSQCQYVSKHKSRLAAHLRAKHDPHAKVYKCRECSYVAQQRSYLLSHVNVMHDPDAKVYKCPHCDYTAKRRYNLTVHVRNRHDPDRTAYSCFQCDYVAEKKTHLVSHLRTKHDIKRLRRSSRLASRERVAKKRLG